MKAIGQWLSQWQHTLLILGLAAIAAWCARYVPDSRWTKLGELLQHIAADPTGAVMLASSLGLVLAAFRAAWQRDPNRPSTPPSSPKSGYAAVDVLYLVVGLAGLAMAVLSLHGCGASALQQSAVGVTVALRAEEAVTAAVTADVERRMSECPPATSSDTQAVVDVHNACVDGVRASVEDLATALSSLELAIRATGAAIAAATEIDAGQPLPAVVLSAIRDVLSLWDRVEALLREKGVDVPREIDLVVAALSALVTA